MTPAFTRKRDTWLHRVNNADAVLMQPLPPIDPLDADILLGRVFGSSIGPALAQRVVAAAALLPDQVGFLVTDEHCYRCGDTNFDDDRVCITCTYPEHWSSRAFLDADEVTP